MPARSGSITCPGRDYYKTKEALGPKTGTWQIADGYYLYQQRLKFDGLPAEHKPALPDGKTHNDEFFGEQQVNRQGLKLKIPAGPRVKSKWTSRAVPMPSKQNTSVSTRNIQTINAHSNYQQRALIWRHDYAKTATSIQANNS